MKRFLVLAVSAAFLLVGCPSGEEKPAPEPPGKTKVEGAAKTVEEGKEAAKEATEGAIGALVDVVRMGRHVYISVPPPGALPPPGVHGPTPQPM